MNSILPYDAFCFVRFTLNKYHHTDCRSGSPYHYIAVMLKGSCRLVSENRTIEVSEGDVFYIPLGLPYQSYWRSDDAISFISLGFRLFPEANDKNYLLQRLNCSDSLKAKLKSIKLNRKINSNTLGLFYNILGQLVPIMETEDLSRSEQIYENAKKHLIHHTSCSASDMAKHCSVSQSTLYLAFKTVAHKTPNDIKNEILCEKAVFLLTTTDKSVQEISDALEFSSTSYFRKTLKKYTGKTPSEIRKTSVF